MKLQIAEESKYRDRRSTLSESADDEIARKGFVSLISDQWGYFVLNDGNFVCKILATDDEDAIRKFYDFCDTDWWHEWKHGTLPKYYGELSGGYKPKDYYDKPDYYMGEGKSRPRKKRTRG